MLILFFCVFHEFDGSLRHVLVGPSLAHFWDPQKHTSTSEADEADDNCFELVTPVWVLSGPESFAVILAHLLQELRLDLEN